MYDYLFVPELPKIAMIPSSDLKEHEVKQQNQTNLNYIKKTRRMRVPHTCEQAIASSKNSNFNSIIGYAAPTFPNKDLMRSIIS